MTTSAARSVQLGNPDNPPQGPKAINKIRTAAAIRGQKIPGTQDGGWARQVTINELPIAKSLAAVDMRLTAGGVRELHWHLPAEWAFVLYGNARITGFDQNGRSFVADV